MVVIALAPRHTCPHQHVCTFSLSWKQKQYVDLDSLITIRARKGDD